MLRPNIEYKINSGLDHHRDFDSENAELKQPTPSESITITDTKVPGLGKFGTPLKVVYSPQAVTIQIDIHQFNLPLPRAEIETLIETQGEIALSDMGSERIERYEYTVIDTVANELGKSYDGENSQAIKNQAEATLVHPSDNVLEKPTDPNVLPFTCQLDPDKFWELN